MIPIWQHVLVVLALLAAHTLTFVTFRRGMERLRKALVAKRALLGDERVGSGHHYLAPGDTLNLSTIPTGTTVRISTNAAVMLTLDYRI